MTLLFNPVFRACAALLLLCNPDLRAQPPAAGPGAVDPTQLSFHRLGVRRFQFSSNNIPLNALIPSEVVGLRSMHPSFAEGEGATPATSALPKVDQGKLILAEGVSTTYVGGVNPYATYELDVRSLTGEAEVALDWATLGLQRRLQIVTGSKGVSLRLIKAGKVEREQSFTATPLVAPYLLRVQLCGPVLGAFATKDGTTTCIGHTGDKQEFLNFIDFRERKLAHKSTFNIAANLPPGATAALGGASSFLSAGIGQADLRLITHKDGAPYWEENRLWFTLSIRGVGAHKVPCSVISLNPSVFDIKLEGVFVFDHGDGLLRNDFSTHLIYNDDTKEWICLSSDFGGVAGREKRGASGLVSAHSKHDPRRGFSIMGNARQLAGIEGMHEDPCLIYDREVKKWRLVTCNLKGFHTELFESEQWDGPFSKIAGPTLEDSTGVLIQKLGDKRYIFSGNRTGPMLVYSYPDLKLLGGLKLDLSAHWPAGPGRGWPNVFPLPEGFQHRYMALMMDRENFPGVVGKDWSYGGMYLFGAHTDDISQAPYEYPDLAAAEQPARDPKTSSPQAGAAAVADPVIEEGEKLTLKGKLKGGLMAIGGETTGWQLVYETRKGGAKIEVDLRTIKQAESFDGTEVTVTGTIVLQQYIERGPVLLLQATTVAAAKVTPEADKSEAAPNKP